MGRAGREEDRGTGGMIATTAVGRGSETITAPTEVEEPEVGSSVEPDKPWLVIVWNDPVNLMTYVTWVFQRLFGYSHSKAQKLMFDVHYKGKAVVSSGAKEKAELDVSRLHSFGLWATMQRSD
jgi:ATP-dependent Clp protease adaptor protein ClpS